MTDRELLELAAAAGGIAGEYRAGLGICPPELSQLHKFWWNPLTDDGDAFRLSTTIEVRITHRTVDVDVSIGDLSVSEYVPTYLDRAEATRRAIVRAAAKIGEGMK